MGRTRLRLKITVVALLALSAIVTARFTQSAAAQDNPRPYSLDDLLARQRLGAVTLSPSKSWLVAQS